MVICRHLCWWFVGIDHGDYLDILYDDIDIDIDDYLGILYDGIDIDHSGYVGIVHGYVLTYGSSLGMYNVLKIYMM